jgi:hypothetical protein
MTWVEMVQYLREQIESLDQPRPMATPNEAGDKRVDEICSRFCATRSWPEMTDAERAGVLFRLEWAWALAAAHGTPVIPFPEPSGFRPWEDEKEFLYWLLVNTREVLEFFRVSVLAAHVSPPVQPPIPPEKTTGTFRNGQSPS